MAQCIIRHAIVSEQHLSDEIATLSEKERGQVKSFKGNDEGTLVISGPKDFIQRLARLDGELLASKRADNAKKGLDNDGNPLAIELPPNVAPVAPVEVAPSLEASKAEIARMQAEESQKEEEEKARLRTATATKKAELDKAKKLRKTPNAR